MNSTGRELSQADLIRNFILMGLEPQLQTEALRRLLATDGDRLRTRGLRLHFDSFMRHYLTVKTGEIPNVGAVYEAFKEYAREPKVASDGVEDLVADIRLRWLLLRDGSWQGARQGT